MSRLGGRKQTKVLLVMKQSLQEPEEQWQGKLQQRQGERLRAELKVVAAREAAQAAAREEIEATRNELSAIHAKEDVVDMMPLEVHVQETTAAMRYAIESTCSSCPYVCYCIHDFSCFE